MDQQLKDIGKELIRLRKEAGYTSYADFAWAHNLSRTQYGRMEKGANSTLKSLGRVLSIHGLSFLEFFVLVNSLSNSSEE